MNALRTNVLSKGRISLSDFAWFVVVYNIAVIIWGAYVRATGSGAGCWSHWPLCNGALFPATAQTQTAIEFTHTTGLLERVVSQLELNPV